MKLTGGLNLADSAKTAVADGAATMASVPRMGCDTSIYRRRSIGLQALGAAGSREAQGESFWDGSHAHTGVDVRTSEYDLTIDRLPPNSRGMH